MTGPRVVGIDLSLASTGLADNQGRVARVRTKPEPGADVLATLDRLRAITAGILAVAAAIRRYPAWDITGNDVGDAVVLAALGARLLGHPIDEPMPATHLRALAKLGAARRCVVTMQPDLFEDEPAEQAPPEAPAPKRDNIYWSGQSGARAVGHLAVALTNEARGDHELMVAALREAATQSAQAVNLMPGQRQVLGPWTALPQWTTRDLIRLAIHALVDGDESKTLDDVVAGNGYVMAALAALFPHTCSTPPTEGEPS